MGSIFALQVANSGYIIVGQPNQEILSQNIR